MRQFVNNSFLRLIFVGILYWISYGHYDFICNKILWNDRKVNYGEVIKSLITEV